MGKVNPAVILFFGALILYVVSIVVDSQNLELFSRPVIIPSIYYFYFISVKGRINLLFSISILSFFIGEILYLISKLDEQANNDNVIFNCYLRIVKFKILW